MLGTPTRNVAASSHQALSLTPSWDEVRAILTDNGPEYIAGTFINALAAKG